MTGSMARNWSARLLFAIDLAGTAVFAMGGALTAIQAGLDLLGVLVLSFCTALGGGVLRDLLIGAVPPVAIQDWRYPVVAFAVGLLTFMFTNWFGKPVVDAEQNDGVFDVSDHREGKP